MMSGTVLSHKQDCNGNSICQKLDNQVMGTCLDDVGFPDGVVMPLTTNLIVQAMYSQCYINENQNLLLEFFIDIQKDPTAISLDKHKAGPKKYNS